MHTESREPRTGGGPRLERAIVLQLLRDDHGPRWSREELLLELGGEIASLDDAVRRLRDDGLLSPADGQLSVSRAVRRLDELGLVGV